MMQEIWQTTLKMLQAPKARGFMLTEKYPRRESNSDLIFRRDLFYPLNYEGSFETAKLILFCVIRCAKQEKKQIIIIL